MKQICVIEFWINKKGYAKPFEKRQVKKNQICFSNDFINEQGENSRFIQRSSKITAVKFLDLLLYNSIQNQCFSLNRLSIGAQIRCDVNISRQGLDQRMNERAVAFVRGLLEKQLTNRVSENPDVGLMKHFNRVCIKDSTKFDIDEQLDELFNLFVTDANEQMLTARAIPLLYKGRWQVELIFKIWKSTFGIHITRKMKIER